MSDSQRPEIITAKTLRDADPAIFEAINAEVRRQSDSIELIASENFVSQAVIEEQGSVFTNKYAEGYPNRRYYGGCVHADSVEGLAIERMKQLYGAEFANVQPHSGSQANQSVLLALLKPGDTILIHAAAGGVGKIVCQWAKHIGATVIGTVGSDEKAEQVRRLGCDYPIVYTQEDFVARTQEITGGRGVDVVYDSVGNTTFLGSLDCLKPLGMMVSFGQSSGPIEPFDVSLLAQEGCLFLTRPNLFAYTSTRDELVATAEELFDVVSSGQVQIEIGQRFPLQEAAAAQQALEGRQTTGSTVLLP